MIRDQRMAQVSRILAVAGVAVSAACTAANASGPFNVLAYAGQQMPGQAPGVVFSNSFSTPSISNDGRFNFGNANFVGTAIANPRAIFSGTNPGDISLLVQSGDQAPGLPAGVLLLTSTGTGVTVSTGSSRINATGNIAYVSTYSGPGVTTGVNDSSLFVGTFAGGVTSQVRRGVTTVAGTGGAVISAAFDTGTQNTTLSANGTIFFKQTMTGGDVSGTTNNTGLFASTPAGVSLIARKGSAAPGTAAGVNYNAIGFVTQSNASGQFLYDTSVAGTGVTTANDTVLYRHTPGSGSTLIVREGTTVMPGTGGATFTGGFTAPGTSFNNSGQAIFGVTLTGGDVSGTTNNVANFFVNSDGTTQLAVRKGQAAAGTDGVFNAISSQQTLYLNNAGQYVFQGSITGGTSTADNDQGVWLSQAGAPSSLSLIMREGDIAPGSQTETIGFGATTSLLNNQGQLLLIMPMVNAATMTTRTGLFAYDPGAPVPLALLAATGDQVEVSPGVFKTISGFGSSSFSNGSSSSLMFNDSGQYILTLSTVDGTPIVVSGQIPAPGAAALLGLGALMAGGRRRRTA